MRPKKRAHPKDQLSLNLVPAYLNPGNLRQTARNEVMIVNNPKCVNIE